MPTTKRSRRYGGRPDRLRIVYSGRLAQHQKRVRDLVAVTRQLDRAALPYRLTVIGLGEEEAWLTNAWAENIKNGSVVMAGRMNHAAIYDTLLDNDIFILVSDFEGMPLSLMEAMACGCVPVVSDIASGIPDLVTKDVGERVPAGDVAGFARALVELASRPSVVSARSDAARARINTGGFRKEDMGDSYAKLINEIWADLRSDQYVRPKSLIYGGPLGGIAVPNSMLGR
jgi:glycosyltransferase involved in cell wall biosynthesis